MDSTLKMGNERIPKLLLTYSLPVYVSYMGNSIYSIISRAFIGNGADGMFGMAAISVAFPVTSILMAFAFLFGMGGSTLAAVKVGAGDKEGANKVLNHSFQLIIAFYVLYLIFGNLFLDKILIAFGASQDVLPYAMEYARILLCGGIFSMIAVGMTNYMRVEGRTGLAMISVFIGPIVNVIAACLLILVLDLGLTGAALASVCGQISCTIIILWHYFSKKSFFQIDKNFLKIDVKKYLEIMYLGLSSFAVNFCQSIVSIFLNRAAKNYGGDLAISGLGVVTTLQQFLLTPVQAINMGWQALLGYNLGAKRFDRIRQLLRTGILAAVVILSAEYICMHLFTKEMVTIFSADNPELIAFSCKALVTFLFMMPIIPIQVQGAGFFQAIRRPIHSVLLSLSRQFIVLLPALFILPRFFGIDGVLYAGPVADFISLLITLPFLIYYYRNLEKICK